MFSFLSLFFILFSSVFGALREDEFGEAILDFNKEANLEVMIEQQLAMDDDDNDNEYINADDITMNDGPPKKPAPDTDFIWIHIATEEKGSPGSDSFRFLGFDDKLKDIKKASDILRYKFEWDFDPETKEYVSKMEFKAQDTDKLLLLDNAGIHPNNRIDIIHSTHADLKGGQTGYLCKQCGSKRARKPGDTCWAIVGLGDKHRGCGCNSGGWTGTGLYYGGFQGTSCNWKNYPLSIPKNKCNQCCCFGGGFAGFKKNGQAKGGQKSVGIKISIAVAKPPKKFEECLNFEDFPFNFCIDDKYKPLVDKIESKGNKIVETYFCPNNEVCGLFKCGETGNKVVMRKTFNAIYLSKVGFRINYNQYRYKWAEKGNAKGTFYLSCDNEKTWKVLREYDTCQNGVYEDVQLIADADPCDKNDNIILKYEIVCDGDDIDFGLIGRLCINGVFERPPESNEFYSALVDEPGFDRISNNDNNLIHYPLLFGLLSLVAVSGSIYYCYKQKSSKDYDHYSPLIPN